MVPGRHATAATASAALVVAVIAAGRPSRSGDSRGNRILRHDQILDRCFVTQETGERETAGRKEITN